jgi:opacity protein-like surface antigen
MLLTLAYDIPLGESFSLRIGPTLGLTYVSMKSKFNSRDEVYNTTGDLMRGTSTTLNRSGSKAVLSYGVTLGARWAFTENLSADLQYRFQCTEKLNLGLSRNYGTATTHQFNAGINYQF